MTKPELLFIAADTPWPPDGGGRIATLRVLEGMAETHTVDLVALTDPNQPIDLTRLRAICRSVSLIEHPFTFGRHRFRQLAVAARSLASPSPYRVVKFRSRALAKRIAELKGANRYQLVHHDQFGVSSYHDHRYPSTLTTQNVESEVYRLGQRAARGPVRRGWARIEALKLRWAEPRLCRRFDGVFVLSESDARLLSDMGVREPVILPMPVDAPESPPQRQGPSPQLLTIGSMSWFGVEDGLLWFHREVWPLIRAAVPEVKWHLVGPNAGSRLRALAEPGRITLDGYLADLSLIINTTRVCLVPLQVAGGVRIKLIEMLANGVPCVSTSIGAQGLTFADGEGCFRRDEPQGFAAAVISLLRDDQLWQRTALAGWLYVRRAHTRPALAAALEAGIEGALHHHDTGDRSR